MQKEVVRETSEVVDTALEARQPHQSVEERIRKLERDLDNLYVVARKLNNRLKVIEYEEED